MSTEVVNGDDGHNSTSRKTAPEIEYLNLEYALGDEFAEQPNDIDSTSPDDFNILSPDDADSKSPLLRSYFAHVPDSAVSVNPNALKDIEDGVQALVNNGDHHVTYDEEEDRFEKYIFPRRWFHNLVANGLVESEEHPNGEDEARLSALGRNFLGILGANKRIYNYYLGAAGGRWGLVYGNEKSEPRDLRKNTAINLGILYGAIRSGVRWLDRKSVV